MGIPAFFTNRPYDVLFVGEQTVHVSRLIAGVTSRGLKTAILNGPRLVKVLQQEQGLDIDHFHCPPIQLKGRYRWNGIRRIESYWQHHRLKKLIARINPAIIHINYIKADYANLCSTEHTRRAMVVTAWGSDLHRNDNDPPEHHQAMRTILQNASMITATSTDLLQCARRWIPTRSANDFKVIWFGIDANLFSADHSSAAQNWRVRLEIPNDAPVILAPRRINPRYHPENVLRAFAQSQARQKGFLIYKLFGNDPQAEQSQQKYLFDLARQLSVLSRIRFAPPCEYGELPGLYKAADIATFLIPQDGAPSTALELMAVGVPIVAADITHYEGLLSHQQNAFLVNLDQLEKAGNIFDYILNNRPLVKPILMQAQQWVREHGEINQTINRYMEIYESALRKLQLRSQPEAMSTIHS